VFDLCQTRATNQLNSLLDASYASATKRAYKSDLSHFLEGGGSIPATPGQIAEYVARLSSSYSNATISRRLVSIAKAHKILAFENPVNTEIVRMASRGSRRMNGIAQKEAKALSLDDLHLIISGFGYKLKEQRDKALLLIGFAGGFRRSEIVGLDFEDLEFCSEGLVISLRSSKTDQVKRGRKVAIPYGKSELCPVRAIRAWLSAADIQRGPIFLTINRHSKLLPKRLSGEAVSITLKAAVRDAGLDDARISGHSLRAGFATAAARAGASAYSIRKQTGHASDAMLSRYIRDAELFKNNAAASIL
jgi:site-specific recombinase XerD